MHAMETLKYLLIPLRGASIVLIALFSFLLLIARHGRPDRPAAGRAHPLLVLQLRIRVCWIRLPTARTSRRCFPMK